MNNHTPEHAGWILDEFDAEEFWQRVNFHGGDEYKDDPLVCMGASAGECWLWMGAKDGSTPAHMYGSFTVWGVKHRAHRIAYRDFGNRILGEQVLDHLCRNTLCVNPTHLEATTQAINMARSINAFANRTHCRNGHEITSESVKHTGKSWRCKRCLSESARRAYIRRKRAA